MFNATMFFAMSLFGTDISAYFDPNPNQIILTNLTPRTVSCSVSRESPPAERGMDSQVEALESRKIPMGKSTTWEIDPSWFWDSRNPSFQSTVIVDCTWKSSRRTEWSQSFAYCGLPSGELLECQLSLGSGLVCRRRNDPYSLSFQEQREAAAATH